MAKKIAILGAGLGGLSASLFLSQYDYQIEIFEKNSNIGGKLGYYENSGYKFDTGPSVLTMPFVIEKLFNSINENLLDYLELIKLDPLNRNFFINSNYIDTYSDIEKMQLELSKFSQKDANNYLKFYNYIKKIYEKAADIFLNYPIQDLNYLFKNKIIPNFLNLIYLDVFKNMAERNQTFFEDYRINQIFNRYATYNGSNPFQTPATMNIISYVEIGLGAYYIKGGIYNLVKTFEKIIKKRNIKINYNSEIQEILIKNNKAIGIKVNNEIIYYDSIISNIDVIETFNHLIKNYAEEKIKLNKLEPSLSGFVILAGIKKLNNNLLHHNVFFSQNYKEEFKQIFKGELPNDPTIYVAITSKNDLVHSPKGCENWFILVNAPYLNYSLVWDNEKNKYKEKIIDKFSQFGFDISNSIELEKVITPQDLYNFYRSNKGSIYGISSNNRMTAFKRPSNRYKKIKNLYFAGGSSHPGGGIPLVILSGIHAATLLNYYINN